MAHQLFHLPKAVNISTAFALQPGAKANFYATGTSTRQNTYQESGLVTPHANPVVADAAGFLAPIYLDPTLDYKLTLTDANDVLIYTVDPVNDDVLSQISVGQALYPQTAAESAAGVTPTNYFYPELNVKRYGAAGDFNPDTGSGTDDRLAIQAAINVAQQYSSGATVLFPHGRYYTGTGRFANHATTNPGTAQIMVGIGGTTESAKNLTLRGEGAELYQGADGKMICAYEAHNVRITGFKIFGYTGGTLGAARQNDTPISISNRSKNVRIDHCYITNSLGDCIAIYGDLAAVATDRFSSNVTIDHCVLKERFGNGTASISGGTMSRMAIAAIDVVGLSVHDNQIYGDIDLEPNLATDHIVDVDIHDNRFRSGHVTAQSSIGTAYWHDEPTALSGGSVLEQGVTLVSVTTPITSNIRVQNNNIEFGRIQMGGSTLVIDLVAGNMFEAGQIVLGDSSISRTCVVDNVAHAPYTGETAFIKLIGSLANSVISNNKALISASWDFCVDTDGSGADGGANTFEGNVVESGTILGFAPAASSLVDYYVGTWTPVLTFATPGDVSVTYTASSGQVGQYVRKYKEATLFFRITTTAFTHTTAVGALQITGSPFTAANVSNVSHQNGIRWGGITKANYTHVNANIDANSAIIAFDASGSGQAISAVAVADVPSGGTPAFIGSVTMQIA